MARRNQAMAAAAGQPLLKDDRVTSLLTRARLLLACCLALACTSCDDKPASKLSPHELAAHPRCRAMCKINGRCQLIEKRCQARTSSDCTQADVCRSSGLCTFQKGRCIGTQAKDCRASEQCKAVGACSLVGRDPRLPCGPANDDDCRASQACKRHGQCTLVAGRCRVNSSQDCAAARDCLQHGRCSAKTVRPTKKPAMPHPPTTHAPTTRHAPVKVCAALSNDDCKKSKDCTQSGACVAVGGICR